MGKLPIPRALRSTPSTTDLAFNSIPSSIGPAVFDAPWKTEGLRSHAADDL
ncbi:hypothetical protein BDV10DRAFT_182835 [Aspergillus recurvatus]